MEMEMKGKWKWNGNGMEEMITLGHRNCVMLNNFVRARWSPMYQYLALTSLRDSHRLPTRHIREPGTNRRLFFSLLYFRFRTSVSVLPFLFQCFPLARAIMSEDQIR